MVDAAAVRVPVRPWAFRLYIPRVIERLGSEDILQWLCAEGCEWDGAVLFETKQGGHSQVETWARGNGAPECSDDY